VCVSHFPQFSFFSPYSRSYSVHFLFSPFLSVSCKFSLNSCLCLIFQVFQFSRHIPDPTVSVVHYPHLSVFSPYSRSYSVCVSFSTFFQLSRHIPCPTVYISHFARFSVILAIFQVLKFWLLIFHVIQFFHHSQGPTGCFLHFVCFSVFLAIIQVLPFEFLTLLVRFLAIFQVQECLFLILHVF
jgi:hypothetical protein